MLKQLKPVYRLPVTMRKGWLVIVVKRSSPRDIVVCYIGVEGNGVMIHWTSSGRIRHREAG